MKSKNLFRILITALICGAFCNCAGTKLTRDVIIKDGINVAAGALAGFATGGNAGATAGALGAEVSNLQRLAKTAPKNPAASVNP